MKATLLQNEVRESIFRQERPGPPPTSRIPTPTLTEVETALRAYCETVLSSDLSEHSQADYINGADNFVRW